MLTPADLLAALGIPPASQGDTDWAASVVAGVNDYVDALPHVDPSAWDARTTTGATLLAQAIYSARSAPDGAAGIDVVGGMIPVKMNPRIGQMLRIAGYTPPRAG